MRIEEITEGRAEEFAVFQEHRALESMKQDIERTAERLNKDEAWKEGALWTWGKFAQRWGYSQARHDRDKQRMGLRYTP